MVLARIRGAIHKSNFYSTLNNADKGNAEIIDSKCFLTMKF